VMLDGEGYSEGHSAVKLGMTRHSELMEMAPDASDPLSERIHENIQINGLTVERWVGPVIAIYEPIANLVLNGVSGTHTGALLVNFESKIDGLVLNNVVTTMIPTPEGEPFVGGMLRYSMAMTGLPASLSEDERAAVVLDGDGVRGVSFANVRVVLAPEARAQAERAGARTKGFIDRTVTADDEKPVLRDVAFIGFDDLP
jgi:hypothetical protein